MHRGWRVPHARVGEKNRTLTISILLMFSVVLMGVAAAGTAAATAEAPECSTVEYEQDGDGNYEIESVAQLQCLGDEGLDNDYVLVSDIDASDTAEWNDGNGFEPIGEYDSDADTEFTGSFEGAGYEITALTIDRAGKADVGLFGALDSSAVVTNITLVDAEVTGFNWVGALAGRNAGGMVAESSATGSVSGNTAVGGLVGSNWEGGTVSESFATAEVAGSAEVGGLVGSNWDGGVIAQSSALGAVTGDWDVGGLLGMNWNGAVERSYATGEVTGDSHEGGLVGYNNGGAVTDSYWDSTTTGQNNGIGENSGDAEGVAGLPTADMTGDDARDNMALDFEETWYTADGEYPVHRWDLFVDDVAAVIDGTPSPTVPVGEGHAIEVTLKNQFDGAVSEETVFVERIEGDGTVVGLAEGDDETTNEDGAVTFSGVTFEGQAATTVSITFTAGADGTDEIEVTLESGDANSVVVERQPRDTATEGSVRGTPTVNVTDEFDNAVEGVGVSVAAVGGNGSLLGTTDLTTDASGLAAFDSLRIEDAGYYRLVFEADGVSEMAVTDTFRVGQMDDDEERPDISPPGQFPEGDDDRDEDGDTGTGDGDAGTGDGSEDGTGDGEDGTGDSDGDEAGDGDEEGTGDGEDGTGDSDEDEAGDGDEDGTGGSDEEGTGDEDGTADGDAGTGDGDAGTGDGDAGTADGDQTSDDDSDDESSDDEAADDDSTTEVEQVDDDSVMETLGGTSTVAFVFLLLIVAGLAAVYKYQSG